MMVERKIKKNMDSMFPLRLMLKFNCQCDGPEIWNRKGTNRQTLLSWIVGYFYRE